MLPADEAERLEVLASYRKAVLAEGSDSLDQLARLTARLLVMPWAFMSLVGVDEATLVGRHNFELKKAPRNAASCAHTILGGEPLVVPSTPADLRFSGNPLTKAGVASPPARPC